MSYGHSKSPLYLEGESCFPHLATTVSSVVCAAKNDIYTFNMSVTQLDFANHFSFSYSAFETSMLL